MQMTSMHAVFKPIGVKPAQGTPARQVVVAAAQPTVTSYECSRRTVASLFASIPAFYTALPAVALIPDDDDEELVERARANRKAKLANERATEKAFARSEGFGNRNELVPVQRAVNALAKTGAALETGDTSSAAAALADGWQSEFKKASEVLSDGSSSRRSIESLFTSLGSLESSAKQGSLSEAKKSFVASVTAFKGWASDVGVASSLKGL